MDDERLLLTKAAKTEYVTVSRAISPRPCWLISVIVSPADAEAVSLVILRNGESNVMEIFMRLTAQYAHPTHTAILPIYFNKGIYLEIDQSVHGVTLQYIEDSQK